jgi:hypothetical protein
MNETKTIYCAIRSGQYTVPAEAGGGTAGRAIVVAARTTREEAQNVCDEWPIEQNTPWSVSAMWVQAVEIDGLPKYDS